MSGRILVFDMDGVLVDVTESYREAIQQTVEHFTGRLMVEVEVTLGRFAPKLAFDPMITADDAVAPKPSPEGLQRIARMNPGKDLWYVGDSVDDARSARQAGVPFIGIAAPTSLRRSELVDLFRAENAIAVLDDINQLEAALPQ